MTLNDFSNMLFSTDNDAIIRVFERDEDVDQYIAGDRGGLAVFLSILYATACIFAR